MTELQPSPAPVRIGIGGADDLDSIMDVMNSAFDPGFGEAWTRSQCAGILPLSGVFLTIARDDADRTLGFSLLREIRDESELLLLAVTPSARRQGIGSALLNHFVDHGRSNGIRRVHLEVRDGNPAVAIYQAIGFKTEGRRPGYYRGKDGKCHDALTMALDIEQSDRD